MARDRILIIDDELITRESVKLQLTNGGFKNLIEAKNGKDAIGLMKQDENMQNVGLVLCDIQMPWVNGVTFVDFMKEQAPKIPVVIITGHPEDDGALSALRKKGVAELLIKPVTEEKLVGAVRKHLVS